MDGLVLSSSWDARRGIPGAILPIMVEGMLLQGAVFNGEYLTEPAPNAKEVMAAPPVTIAFVERGEEEGSRGYIDVPVYMTLTRERFLTEVKIPCGKGEEGAWILSGAALMLQE